MTAAEWLKAHGYSCPIGKDPVTAANYYAAEDEKARMAGTYITFNATRCAKDCLGWNTNSRRCDCYAHPVAWVVAKDHTFEKPHVYAEAQ